MACASMGTCSLLGIGSEYLCVEGLLWGFCDERDPQVMLGIEPGSVSCKAQAFTPKPSLQLGALLLAHGEGLSHSEYSVCVDFRVSWFPDKHRLGFLSLPLPCLYLSLSSCSKGANEHITGWIKLDKVPV